MVRTNGKETIESDGENKTCAICGSTENLSKSSMQKGVNTYCPKCMSVCGEIYQNMAKGRFCQGDSVLVTKDQSYLAKSIKPNSEPFQGLQSVNMVIKGKGKGDKTRLITEFLLDPPKPPFLFFFGVNNNAKLASNLKVSWSLERTWICSDVKQVVNIEKIKTAIKEAMKIDVDSTKLSSLFRLNSNDEKDMEKLDKAEEQYPGVNAVLGLMKKLSVVELTELFFPAIRYLGESR